MLLAALIIIIIFEKPLTNMTFLSGTFYFTNHTKMSDNIYKKQI